VPGTDNGRFFTPSQGDSQMKAIVDATSTGFLQAFASLGGSGTPGFNFGLGFDNDPSGSAQSRVSSMLTDASGQQIYGTHDVGMDDKDVPAALQLEAQRMLLAALQHSDLPKDVADILNSVVAAGATSDEIDGVIAKAREMKAVLDGLGTLEWGHLDVAGSGRWRSRARRSRRPSCASPARWPRSTIPSSPTRRSSSARPRT
jgi:hypothetical protein